MNKKIMVSVIFLALILILVSCSKSYNISEGFLQEVTDKEMEEKFKDYKAIKLKDSNDYVVETLNINSKNIGGLTCRDNDIILTDTSDNCLIVMDYNHSFIKKIGKSGNGSLEFLSPIDVAISNEKIFVLDSNNMRIQILDKDFNFLEDVSYKDVLKSYDKSANFVDIEVDNDENIYLSTMNGNYSKILVYVTSAKQFKEIGNNFHGCLSKYKDEIFAINIGSKMAAEKDTFTGIRTGYNYMFKINPEKMLFLEELYFGIMPSGVVKVDEGLYLVSQSYNSLMFFDESLNYKYSLLKLNDLELYSYMANSEYYGLYLSYPEKNKILNIRKKVS